MSFPAVDPNTHDASNEPDENNAIEADEVADTEGDAPEDAAFEDEPVREAA